ncbi:MAG: galactokinase [Rikenellaceae bacterium]|nr:galactokinase [Rikenellaceae bacterium]
MSQRVQEEFAQRYGAGARFYASPGRINLIGEHTDYNLGFVLPAAVDKAIYLAVAPTGADRSRLYSIDFDQELQFDLTGGEKPQEQWACYIYGVVQEMMKRGARPGNFDCVLGGDVPLGAGMSSSAALESVVGYAVNDLFGLGFDRADLAKIGQMTEHNYIGVRCGIMDQFASLFGRCGQVIRLDCRSLEYEMTPFDPQGYRLVLIDSMVKHSLASSEYNVRRAQCEAGVAAVARHAAGVESLRDVTREMLDTYRSEMDELTYRRCAYVIDENRRLLDGCELLKHGDYKGFGEKMFGSHEGLSKEYNVSCRELDFIAGIARSTDGVIGARMMGGGFGGCVINLVEESVHDSYLDEVKGRFEREFGLTPRTIDVVIGDGARRLDA